MKPSNELPTSQATLGKGQSHAALLLLPADVEPEQVIEVLVVIATNKPGARLFELSARSKKRSIEYLLPILKTAELLHLIKIDEKGIVSLTELGAKFHELPSSRVQILREQLSLIEPFHTAIELATRRTGVSIAEIVEGLDRKGIRWHESDEEINLAIVHNLLVRWSIIGNLLTYDGRTAKFKKVMITLN
ncbi:MAG: AAA-associated domain-containing protein, partial [Thaumarchaeota archaeon]|nr:AAA-associated domain-containing protein [Nitrososphaerota archaeon]